MTKSGQPGSPPDSSPSSDGPSNGMSSPWLEATRLELPSWVPHAPHEQQQIALVAPRFIAADPCELFYGGAAGGGKSDWLLMAALQYVDVPGYAALILRRTLAEFELPGALVARSKEWLTETAASWNESRKTWSFPASSSLSFGYLEHEDDVYRYQSAEFQMIGFDELTKFSQAQWEYMFSRLRKPSIGPLSRVKLRMCGASNPGGPGHTWVKHRFVDTQTAPGRVFVPAKLADNPSVDQSSYVQSLSHLGETLREQLLAGDWSAFEGAAYPSFSEAVHVIGPVEAPAPWERFEGMDFGSTNPTAWLVFCVDYDGNLILLDGYYRAGLPSQTAPRILRLREQAWEARDDFGRRTANTCWADPAVWATSGTTNRWGLPASVADEFEDEGVHLVRANNDRRAGYVRIAELLKPDGGHAFPAWHPRAGEPGSPRLFIVRTPGTQPLLAQLEVAPLEADGEPYPGEAVSRRWEGPHGHAHAALRYGVMSRPEASSEPQHEQVVERTGAYLKWLDEEKAAARERLTVV